MAQSVARLTQDTEVPSSIPGPATRFRSPSAESRRAGVSYPVNVYVFFVVCVFQNRVRPITSSYMVGFKNYLVQMLITTRQYVTCKNQVAITKVNVTVGTLNLRILELCPTHFI